MDFSWPKCHDLGIRFLVSRYTSCVSSVSCTPGNHRNYKKNTKLISLVTGFTFFLNSTFQVPISLNKRVSRFWTTLQSCKFWSHNLNNYIPITYSAGRHQDLGYTLYSLGNCLNMRFMFRARESFRQISLIPGKWLIFYKENVSIEESLRTENEQECISVECKPPACWQYGLHKIKRDLDILSLTMMWLSLDVSP